MQVIFKGILCDVTITEYEGEKYYKALVYQDQRLHQVSIKKNVLDEFKAAVGNVVNFSADLRDYDGKAKYYFSQDSVLQIVK